MDEFKKEQKHLNFGVLSDSFIKKYSKERDIVSKKFGIDVLNDIDSQFKEYFDGGNDKDYRVFIIEYLKLYFVDLPVMEYSIIEKLNRYNIDEIIIHDDLREDFLVIKGRKSNSKNIKNDEKKELNYQNIKFHQRLAKKIDEVLIKERGSY